jgi:hypothetical protein
MALTGASDFWIGAAERERLGGQYLAEKQKVD